jgi:hypothetical protein
LIIWYLEVQPYSTSPDCPIENVTKKYGWILAEACCVWNVSALSADGRACNNGKRVSALHRRLLERFIRTPQLVFLESRIASPVVSIGGELEREAGGPTPLRHLV